MATREAIAPLACNPIMSDILIWSFRHLEHQNLSINLGDIGRASSMQQFRNGGMEGNGGTEEERNTVDTMSVLICLNINGYLNIFK